MSFEEASMRDIGGRFCIGRAATILDEVTQKSDHLHAPVLLGAATEWRKLAELLFANSPANTRQHPGATSKETDK